MNVWLVTLGSSDVQLRDAGAWSDWYQEIKRSIYTSARHRFEPSRTDESDGVPYRTASRVLGVAYEEIGEELWEQLAFPLLESFCGQLQSIAIDRIIVLTSDQSSIFDGDDRESYRCPYWQDTCLLYPIVSRYLQSLLPAAEISELVLVPGSLEAGLDDWDAVLKLVRREIGGLNIEPEKVYVSHQAGTPAISSAVQFSSLARFGDRVEFLVSSEYRPDRTRVLEGSEYLGALRLQEAKALLDRYDYSGVERLLGRYLDPQKPEEKRMKVLLEAAIEWNHAEFYKFRNKLKKGGAIAEDAFPWWRLGYESAYLAWVRLQQENTVEALFHSFRGLEGTVLAWAKHTFSDHIQQDPKFGAQLKDSIVRVLPEYRAALSKPNRDKFDQYRNVGLYGDPLYELLKQAKPEWVSHSRIQIVWTDAKDQRNSAFHRIEGLQKEEVFQAWKTENEIDWELCVLSCLNFVTGQSFGSLREGSLMAKVHGELKGAIAIYEAGG
jgi:hypothetical protein